MSEIDSGLFNSIMMNAKHNISLRTIDSTVIPFDRKASITGPNPIPLHEQERRGWIYNDEAFELTYHIVNAPDL